MFLLSRSRQLADHAVRFFDVAASVSEPHTTLILLHGGAVDRRMWTPQLEAFPERRVIAPDARGHGGSSDADVPYRLADDVVAVMDALEVDRAVLAGVSMGGGTAVDVALEHPDRCAALVVTGTGTSEPVFDDPWTLAAFRDWVRAEAAGDADAWVDVFMRFTHGPHRTRADLDPTVDALVEQMARETLLGHLRFDPNGTPVPPTPPSPVPDTWGRVPGIDVPVLALNGALDASDHLENGRRLAELIPTGRYLEIPRAAHYPNLEQPVEYARTVRDFLHAHDL